MCVSIALASHKGVIINFDDIPIREETNRICTLTGDDPLGIFSSGALLISISPEKAEGLLCEYEKKGIVAARIGEVVAEEEGRILRYGNMEMDLEASHTDGLIERLNL